MTKQENQSEAEDFFEIPAEAIVCYFIPSNIAMNLITNNAMVAGHLHIQGQIIYLEFPMKDIHFVIGA